MTSRPKVVFDVSRCVRFPRVVERAERVCQQLSTTVVGIFGYADVFILTSEACSLGGIPAFIRWSLCAIFFAGYGSTYMQPDARVMSEQALMMATRRSRLHIVTRSLLGIIAITLLLLPAGPGEKPNGERDCTYRQEDCHP